MPRRTENLPSMNAATSFAVCRGIGERLQRNLTDAIAALPARLQTLLDELRRRENAAPRPSD